jgi:hypothetical protein
MKNYLRIILATLFILVVGFFILNNYIYNEKQADEINSYQACAEAGYPILESYPEQCQTPDGRTFTRELSEDDYRNMIAPITVEGEFVCLPPKDSSGPINDICFFGLLDDNGDYYGLTNTNTESNKLGTIDTSERIEVSGIYTPGMSLEYRSIGTIEVETVIVVDEEEGL